MIKITEETALKGNCILNVIYPIKEINEYTEDEIKTSKKIHKEKIRLSDVIL